LDAIYHIHLSILVSKFEKEIREEKLSLKEKKEKSKRRFIAGDRFLTFF